MLKAQTKRVRCGTIEVIKLFKKATEISYALFPTKRSGRCFHVTCIFDKNRLVSVGWNNHKTHPFAAQFNYKNNTGESYVSSLHSEVSAFLKLGEENCRKLTFINVRVNNLGKLDNSYPCFGCRNLLKQIGFRRFYYSCRGGEFKQYSRFT